MDKYNFCSMDMRNTLENNILYTFIKTLMPPAMIDITHQMIPASFPTPAKTQGEHSNYWGRYNISGIEARTSPVVIT